MRTMLCLPLLLAVSCGSGSSEPRPTSGPLESIVKTTSDALRVKAVRHAVPLADLPVARLVGLPASGTLELDAALTAPVLRGKPDYRRADGTIAIRCLGTCTLGDDVARLRPLDPSAFTADGIAFSHLDFAPLEAQLNVADGHARLTHWRVTSPDLEIHLELELTLAADLADTLIDACLRFRPTDALRARDPNLHTLLSLLVPTRGPDDLFHVRLTGTAAKVRALPRICGADAPPPSP